MSDSPMAIWVEPNQCPSHHLILLTQGPIHEILAEIAQLLTKLKNSVFLSRPFWIFFSKKKKFFLLHSHENMPKFIGKQGFFEILMITLVSSPNNTCLLIRNTVSVKTKLYRNWCAWFFLAHHPLNVINISFEGLQF